MNPLVIIAAFAAAIGVALRLGVGVGQRRERMRLVEQMVREEQRARWDALVVRVWRVARDAEREWN